MLDINKQDRESTLKMVFESTPCSKKEEGNFLEYLHRTGSQPYTPTY